MRLNKKKNMGEKSEKQSFYQDRFFKEMAD